MEQQGFTALELYCLAYLCRKTNMYGLPDVYSAFPDEEKQSVMRRTIDSLTEKNAVVMDFDGNLSVSESCRNMVNVYCDCNKCMTVNIQKMDGSADSAVFWNTSGKLYGAVITDDYYWISETDKGSVNLFAARVSFQSVNTKCVPDSTILNTALQKAKRLANEGNTEEALRVLMQNGSSEAASSILLNSLLEKNDYFCIVLISPNSGETAEKAWIGNGSIILELKSDSVNYRPCTTFSEVTSENVRSDIGKILESFFVGGD